MTKVYEILQEHATLLRRMNRAGVAADAVRHLDLYGDYSEMVSEGTRPMVAARKVAHKYSTSERSVFRIVGLMERDC